MRLFSTTLSKAILSLLENRNTGRILVTLPSYPPQVLFSTVYILQNESAKSGFDLKYVVAQELVDKWEPSEQQRAHQEGLDDPYGSLTKYRNEIPAHALNLVVLCGVDRITDSASLSDFPLFDENLLWNTYGSDIFKDWLEDRFIAAKESMPGKKDLVSSLNILNSLRQLPGGLLHISEWLDKLDLSYIRCGKDLEIKLLESLPSLGFDLPKCCAFADRKGKNKNFSEYIRAAKSFFNGNAFIQSKDRKSAFGAIEKFQNNLAGNSQKIKDEENKREKYFSSYSSLQDLIDGLKNYIETNNENERIKLHQCDFVYIHDTILRAKSKRIISSHPKEIALYGTLIEVLLNALWLALKEIHKDLGKEIINFLPLSMHIKGTSCQYNIDFSENDTPSLSNDVNEFIKEQMYPLLNGLDEFFAQGYLVSNEIKVRSSIVNDKIVYRKSKKTPTFHFEIVCAYQEGSQERILNTFLYKWILPEKHIVRLNDKLIRRAKDSVSNSRSLPVYHLPYYGEILSAQDDQETREILHQSLRDDSTTLFAENLLDSKEISGQMGRPKDPLLGDLNSLAYAYGNFIQTAAEKGLLHALLHKDDDGSGVWFVLQRAYRQSLDKAQECILKSTLSPLLLRAFLIVRERSNDSDTSWYLSEYEDSAIVSILHPALLEQIRAQIFFLCAGFLRACKDALAETTPSFELSRWQYYVSLAQLQTPLCTLITSPEKKLATKVWGEGYLHKILGDSPKSNSSKQATLTTRIHTSDEQSQDDISDSKLFEESAESALLCGFMDDYCEICPQTADGISIAIFRNTSIQPVIAGIHAFLKKLFNDKEFNELHTLVPYEINISFFSRSSDAADINHWLEHWRERWEAVYNDTSVQRNAFYRNCQFKITHHVVRNDQDIVLALQHTQVDIAVLYDILSQNSNNCELQEIEQIDIRNFDLQFPILEKKYCNLKTREDKLTRTRIISSRQFPLSAEYSNLLFCIQNRDHTPTSTILLRTGDFSTWQASLQELHKRSEWVICIDPAIDENLVRNSSSRNKVRDIIAFGSGVGTHGEANYTISSEQLSCNDLARHVEVRLANLYGDYKLPPQTYSNMARQLLVMEKPAGLALIRAASLKDDHIHEFLAYALTRRLLSTKDALFDVMISLDAYRHWFPFGSERPDLLWITGKDIDGILHLQACLIECKLRHKYQGVVDKAHDQLRSGLNRLVPLFRPISNESLDDDRPDRRAWWYQLHRVITNRLQVITGDDANRLLVLMEKLTEGQFAIQWKALLLTYWSDDSDQTPVKVTSWAYEDFPGVTGHHYVIGYPLQIRLGTEQCLPPDLFPKIWEEGTSATPLPKEETPKVAEEDSRSVESTEEESDGFEAVDEEDDEAPSWERGSWQEDPTLKTSDEEEKKSNDFSELDRTSNDQEGTDNKSDTQKTDNTQTLVLPEEVISTSSSAIPEEILLGYDPHKREVYWPFKNATNRHLLIFGSSGNGKTYAIQCLLAELARKGLNTAVLDYSQSFVPREIKPEVSPFFPTARQHFVLNKPLPINPFTLQMQDLGGIQVKDSPQLVAQRIVDIFSNVFKSLGIQQRNILKKTIADKLKGSDSTSLIEIRDTLYSFLDNDVHDKKTVETLSTYVDEFADLNLFSDSDSHAGWNTLYSTVPACNHVFQLMNIPPNISAGIIEFVLWDLFFYAQRGGNEQRPSVVVLDEIQNLRLNEGSPVEKILREGRKFGLALIAATQSFAGVNKFMAVLNQAAYKLLFRPADNELADFGRHLNNIDSSYSANEWKEQLARLKKGDCFVVGPTDQGRPIRFVHISSMEERGFGK